MEGMNWIRGPPPSSTNSSGEHFGMPRPVQTWWNRHTQRFSKPPLSQGLWVQIPPSALQILTQLSKNSVDKQRALAVFSLHDERWPILAGPRQKSPSGAKARYLFGVVAARLKPCPCYKTLRTCFGTTEVAPFQSRTYATGLTCRCRRRRRRWS
jgi:hypothetical protein